MTMEIADLSKVLTNSRLASFYEIAHGMSQMRKDLPDNDEELGKMWNELRDGLMRGVRLEVIQFEVLAKEMDKELEHIQHNINNYFIVRDKCTCTNDQICGAHVGLVNPNR
ncbi:uncharacterized protein LOC130713713 [Lotus japonicus]|uniref:uncharacterized protein LOC130713713 n=1 Tax=Lotus japonicus TaxID=34305 RepID=UPI002588E4D2|nr:uncharacterized protein LOC130713713 [Lotus japonicus]